MAGAPLGNQNAKNGNRARRAILRALARKGGTVGKGLDLAADKLVAAAADAGEQWAQKELYDRVDGKPSQPVDARVAADMTLTVMVKTAEELRAKIRGA